MSVHRQTDRAFGFTMAGGLAFIFGVLWLAFDLRAYNLLYVAIGFAVFAVVAPAVLLPLNRIWSKVAGRLGAMNNRIILGIFFGLFIIPAGFLLRVFGHDPMSRGFDRTAQSYLVPVRRDTDPENLRDMF